MELPAPTASFRSWSSRPHPSLSFLLNLPSLTDSQCPSLVHCFSSSSLGSFFPASTYSKSSFQLQSPLLCWCPGPLSSFGALSFLAWMFHKSLLAGGSDSTVSLPTVFPASATRTGWKQTQFSHSRPSNPHRLSSAGHLKFILLIRTYQVLHSLPLAQSPCSLHQAPKESSASRNSLDVTPGTSVLAGGWRSPEVSAELLGHSSLFWHLRCYDDSAISMATFSSLELQDVRAFISSRILCLQPRRPYTCFLGRSEDAQYLVQSSQSEAIPHPPPGAMSGDIFDCDNLGAAVGM